MNNMVDAIYKEQIIEEYRGNPFIEALPAMDSKEEVIDNIASYPIYSQEDRLLEENVRIHLISQRVGNIFQPLIKHIELERKISVMIKNGYISRNPITKEYVESYINGYRDINKIDYKRSNYTQTASSLSIIGMSGMGKTSSINRILSIIPQVINHSHYRGKCFNVKQVAWIKIDCTYDGSVKGLLIDFFSKVDEIIDTNYFEKYGNSKRTTDTLLSIMSQVCRNIGLGLLVIDEIQHLSMAKSGGADKMLNFFTTLVNVVGVPVVMVGTMAAKDILQSDFRMARRNLGSDGNVIWDRLKNDESWDLLIDTLWKYQYTKYNSKLTKELSDLIYFESQGIIDIAIKIFSIAQIQAISTGKEEITVDIIGEIVNNSMNAVKPMISALKSGNLREIARFKDICTVDYEDQLKNSENDIDISKKINEYRDAKRKKKLGKKEEALKQLVKLDINKKKAIIAIESILRIDSNISVNKLVIESIKEIDNIKLTDKRELILSDVDIRKIVAKSESIDEIYLNLSSKGYITNADSEWREAI